MLSRILSAREGARAQPIVFSPISLTLSQPGGQTPQADASETTALRQSIRRLESEIAAAREEGFQAGSRQARNEITPVIERMNASIAEMAGMRQSLRRAAEKDVVQLAMLIARRILHRELTIDPNALTALVRMAFDRLSRAENCRIVVHPQFAEAITAALPASQMTRIRIESDPACEPGTLVIHSTEGTIDASVDAQLEEIGKGLTDLL